MSPLEHRIEMIEQQCIGRGIRDARVVQAMLKVPRHSFVAGASLEEAYSDRPLQIGEEQTISQPYMVARMTELLRVPAGARVLEVGTGSGYQTAILAELAAQVLTIERHASLSEHAASLLERLGYSNIRFRVGDGTIGWKEEAPFDRVVITAGSPSVPDRLLSQLAEGGILVLPLGAGKVLDLVRFVREEGKILRQSHGKCAFVKLIGRFGWPEPASGDASDRSEEP
jgi:protein-L-isoaspartate(D-aspartate) O-methyltransferase